VNDWFGNALESANERADEACGIWQGSALAPRVVPVREGLRLTPRQSEVLALLCEGLPTKTICRRLGISYGTAKVHIGAILRELGASSRLQAVLYAQRLGLLR
jgi:DNA-binding NarL/FixJ family response regulator